VVVDAVLILFTFYVAQGLPMAFWLRPMSLGAEQSPATWWSGIQLLVFALAIHGLSHTVYEKDRVASRGLLALSTVGLLLFWDEIGSIHERATLLFGMESQTLSLLPLAVLGGSILAYSLWVLFRKRGLFGQAWWRVLVPFILFATVYVQELAEHAIQWPHQLRGLRMAVEEGTELVGMFMLLSAAVYLMSRLTVIDGDQAKLIDLFPSQHSMVWFFKVCIVLALPLVLLWSSFTYMELGPRRGHFANTITIALFFLAATIAFRNSFAEPRHAQSWIVLAIVLLILSLDAECRFHHYLWHDNLAIRLRPDIGLLWGVPMLLLAAAFHPRLRTLNLIYFGVVVMAVAVVAINAPFSILQHSLPIAVSLLVFAQLLNLNLGYEGSLSTDIGWGNKPPVAIDDGED
jgi:hypothetical protein